MWRQGSRFVFESSSASACSGQGLYGEKSSLNGRNAGVSVRPSNPDFETASAARARASFRYSEADSGGSQYSKMSAFDPIQSETAQKPAKSIASRCVAVLSPSIRAWNSVSSCARIDVRDSFHWPPIRGDLRNFRALLTWWAKGNSPWCAQAARSKSVQPLDAPRSSTTLRRAASPVMEWCAPVVALNVKPACSRCGTIHGTICWNVGVALPRSCSATQTMSDLMGSSVCWNGARSASRVELGRQSRQSTSATAATSIM